MVGERVVDGHDRIGTPDPAGLPAAVPGQDRSGHVLVVVRVEDGVDDVVDDEAAPPGVRGRRAARSSATGRVRIPKAW